MIVPFYGGRPMYSGETVFSQLMQQRPWWRFQTFVDRDQGDYKVKTFRYAEHFRVMVFAQLTYRESLRDIEACLRAMEPKLYHMGIRGVISQSVDMSVSFLSHQNRKDDRSEHISIFRSVIAGVSQRCSFTQSIHQARRYVLHLMGADAYSFIVNVYKRLVKSQQFNCR